MPRLDVYPTPGHGSGYVVDVQAGLLEGLATRAVIPLLPTATAPAPLRELNPVFDIEGAPHVLLTQAIASVPARELRRPVASLARERDAITRALDILFLGY